MVPFEALDVQIENPPKPVWFNPEGTCELIRIPWKQNLWLVSESVIKLSGQPSLGALEKTAALFEQILQRIKSARHLSPLQTKPLDNFSATEARIMKPVFNRAESRRVLSAVMLTVITKDLAQLTVDGTPQAFKKKQLIETASATIQSIIALQARIQANTNQTLIISGIQL